MDEASDRKHVFVCYSHDDTDVVSADVAWLRSLDLAAWDDQRIHAGATWADEIAHAIDRSTALLFFVSRTSMVSAHCLNEIAYAIDAEKSIISVFLENIEVSGGLKLFIGRTQAIVRDRLSVDEYRQQVRQAVSERLLVGTPRDVPLAARLWRVPLRRNAGFAGRDSLLTGLSSAFETRRDVPIVLVGLPGVGKSQAALEFVYRNQERYSVVAWLRAEEAATLNTDFMQLAYGLNVAGANDPDPRVVVDAVKRWLAANEHWLLVFDNANEPSLVAPYLPERLTGHVLITSTRQNWGRWSRRVQVEEFDEREAIEFLSARTGSVNREAVAELANALGRLPLALEEAAAYIEATGRTIASYVKLFREHHDVLMSQMPAIDGYPRTLRTAFEVSLRQVESEDPNAADLLRMLAFVAADDIPNALWDPYFANKSEPQAGAAALVLDRCIASLRKFSLISAQGDSLSLHRLVQLVSYDRMSVNERRDAASEVLLLVERAFPHVKDRGYLDPISHRYLPHALAILSRADATSAHSVVAGELWGRTGTFLSAYNSALEAQAHLENAFQIFKDDAAHRRLFARTAELYGRVLYHNGELLRSEEVYAEAVRAYQTSEGENTIRLMQVHLELAWVHWTAGNLTQALRDADRCLEVLHASAGENDPRAVAGRSIRARIFMEQGRVADAQREVEYSIVAIEALGGFRVPLMCAVFMQMSQVLQDLGFPLRAISWAQEALNLGKGAFSEHHALMTAARCALGQSLVTIGELELAKAEFSTVVESVRGSVCPQNQIIGIASAYLCLLSLELGETDNVTALLAEAERTARLHVSGDRTVITSYVCVARSRVARNAGDYTRVVQHLDEASESLARRFAPQHPYWLPILREQAAAHRESGDLVRAQTIHERALAIANESDLARHFLVADHLLGLSDIARQRGNAARGAELRKRALDIYRERLGASSKRVLALQ